MSAKLVYDKGLMESVSQKYTECKTSVNDLISTLDQTAKLLSDNYEGQGEEVSFAVFTKLKEHLELLCQCFEQTGKYVDYSLANMQEVDSKIAKEMRT